MFKSCDYCRHRKKKCVVPDSSAGRCSDCEHLDLQCRFSQRSFSVKRRETSRRIAAKAAGIAVSASPEVEADAEAGSGRRHSGDGDVGDVIDEANLKEGDCQLRIAGRHDMANKRLLQPRTSSSDYSGSPLSASERYLRDVHPFWPFLPAEILRDDGEPGADGTVKQCIDLAWRSLNLMPQPGDDSLHATERLVSALQQAPLSMSTVACTLLLFPYVSLDHEVLQKAVERHQIFDTVGHEAVEAAICIPPTILSGVLLTNVWRRLTGHDHPRLRLSVDILQAHAEELDPATFAHHYIRLSRLAAELDRLRTEPEEDGIRPSSSSSSAAPAWARLEYECLLWQVCLAPALLDTRDDLPATPESVVIHCFSSLLLLSLYSHVLERADTLGALIALQPVPGALLFICTLARSTFICPRRLLDRMPVLVDIQAQTARIMSRLWRRTGFENCRAILNLWEDPGGRFPDLAREVRREIGPGPWAIDEIDGYSVFWTFRDLRTLTTKFILTNTNCGNTGSPYGAS